MFLKLITLFLSISSSSMGNDSTVAENDMLGKWHIKYCYQNNQFDNCKNCQKETADLVYVFKKKVFSEVMEDSTVVVLNRRYGSWSIDNNVLIENTTQKLNGKVIKYVHEYKLVKLSNDKYFVTTIEDNAPLYIYYCRIK